MTDAIDLLIDFGDAYAAASLQGAEGDMRLVRQIQTLLVLLTNQAVLPNDVEKVLPFEAVLSDA